MKKLNSIIILLLTLNTVKADLFRIYSFKVVDVTSEGCRIQINYNEDYFLYGFNGYSDRTYGEIYSKSFGDYTYKTVIGSERRIPALKYLDNDSVEVKEYLRLEMQRNDKRQKMLRKEEIKRQELLREENAKRQELLKAEEDKMLREAEIKRQEINRRVINFKLMKATNDYDSYQYEVGIMYLNGTTGIETNKNLAIYWLTKSAKQNNINAIKILNNLKISY